MENVFTLEIPEALQGAEFALQRIGMRAEEVAWTILHGVRDDEASIGPVAALKKESGMEGDELERLLLWHATLLPCRV